MPAAPDHQVGSIAEETARLVVTLAEWVRVETAACPFVQEAARGVTDTVTAICQSVRDLIDGMEATGRARSTTGFQMIDLDDPEGT